VGGEPLVEDDHYSLLEKLLELGRTDVELDYNSNLSILHHKEWAVLALWRRFKTVYVSASIDGVGPQLELLRAGAHWSTIKENLESIRRHLPHVDLTFFPTVSVMNCFHIADAIPEWIGSGLLSAPHELTLNILTGPRHLSMNLLNQGERAKLRSRYRQVVERLRRAGHPHQLVDHIESQLSGALARMTDDSGIAERRSFTQFTQTLDTARGESFQRLFPELDSFFLDQPPSE
jgi:hypothetical protein